MSVDINTTIRVKGTTDDTSKFVQYVLNNKYLNNISLNDRSVVNFDLNEIKETIKKENIIEAMGPYGKYLELKDTKVSLFELIKR